MLDRPDMARIDGAADGRGSAQRGRGGEGGRIGYQEGAEAVGLGRREVVGEPDTGESLANDGRGGVEWLDRRRVGR